MTIFSTYRTMVAQLTAGIDWCQARLGQRWMGTMALLGDELAEGARQALFARMPGHPEQAEDSLNQCGSDAGLFRYRAETIASWRARVSDPWARHEQAGTPIALLREIDIWGAITYSSTWAAGQCYLVEGTDGTFTLIIPAGLIPWGSGYTLGGGHALGEPNFLLGISNAGSEDISTLKSICRALKPARSKGAVIVVVSGHFLGMPGFTLGGGGTLGGQIYRLDV